MGLALECADHNALDEVLLEEGVYAEDRNSGDYAASHLDAFGVDRTLTGLLCVSFLHGEVVFHGNDDAVQHQLQGLQALVGIEDHGVMFIKPGASSARTVPEG